MGDPYLQAMLHGDYPSKDKYDLAIEKQINKFIDSLNLENEYAHNKLISPRIKRAQIQEEIKKAMKYSELSQHISTAFSFLINDGAKFIEKNLFQEMSNQFEKMKRLLKEEDFNQEINENIQSHFQISNEVLIGIQEIGIAQFLAKEFSLSASIFVLLTILNPEKFEYWYRLGIAAQKSGDYNLALKAYMAALELNGELIGARIFSIECYLRINAPEKAREILLETKKINLESEWLSLLEDIEATLGNE